MTTEDMKIAWAETSRRLEKLENDYYELRQEAMNGKRRTSLENLAVRYRRFSIISLIFTFISPFYAFNGVFTGDATIWVPILMTVYFAVASTMDWWLYKRIKSIDVTTMSAGEVSEASALCRKRHIQFMFVLIPVMSVILAGFIFGTIDETYMMIGIIAGAVSGFAIGVCQFINFMADYKILRGDRE